jgi:hypothetical protein
VISLSAGDQPVLLSSKAVPRILDAIPFGKGDTYECYERRYENMSCEAESAQGGAASLIKDLPKRKARVAVQQKSKTAKAAQRPSQHADLKSQRRKKIIVANGQNQKRLKKSQTTQKAALVAVAGDKPVRRKSKGVICILFGHSCGPNT